MYSSVRRFANAYEGIGDDSYDIIDRESVSGGYENLGAVFEDLQEGDIITDEVIYSETGGNVNDELSSLNHHPTANQPTHYINFLQHADDAESINNGDVYFDKDGCQQTSENNNDMEPNENDENDPSAEYVVEVYFFDEITFNTRLASEVNSCLDYPSVCNDHPSLVKEGDTAFVEVHTTAQTETRVLEAATGSVYETHAEPFDSDSECDSLNLSTSLLWSDSE